MHATFLFFNSKTFLICCRRDSFITHRAFCDALAHESARHPSSVNHLGTHHLYGTNHMSLGLGAQLQNHQISATNSILSLGSEPKFEHLISPNLHHSSSSSFGVQSDQFPLLNDPNKACIYVIKVKTH